VNNKLVYVIAVFHFFSLSASSLSPQKGSMRPFSPYSPISYLAPSPKSVAQFSPTKQVKKVESPVRKASVVCKTEHKDEFIEVISEHQNIDKFIALALKHEESLLRRSLAKKSI